MLAADFKRGVQKAFKAEGGFQKDPADSANYVKGKLIGTNRGISAIAFYNHYKKIPTEQDMRNLTQAQAMQIYKANYWDKIRADEIKNDSVADLMFQYVIGSGLGSIKELKQIANNTAGKKLFAETIKPFTSEEIKLINGLKQDRYHANLKTYRANKFKRIVAASPEKKKFLKGWMNRLDTHVYSGKTSFNYKPWLIGGSIVIGLTGLYLYQNPKEFNKLKRLVA